MSIDVLSLDARVAELYRVSSTIAALSDSKNADPEKLLSVAAQLMIAERLEQLACMLDILDTTICDFPENK